jgi:type I restriction enzyme S subunit
MVPLGEVLDSVSRPEAVSPEKTYDVLGAHWYAAGLYTKETLTGAEIRAPKVYRVEAGDFVYNRLFAWKGSFAVATKVNHGCFVSNEFPCFRVKADRISVDFLRWYFAREPAWTEALGLSSGGTPTSRNRLKEEAFLRLAIPLPSIAEQRRLVERIDALAAKIEEARRLRAEADDGVAAVLTSMAHRRDLSAAQKSALGWNETTLQTILTQRADSVAVKTTESYPNLGIYSFGRGLFKKPPISGLATSASTLFRVHAAQFIYSRLFAFEGAYGVVAEPFDGHFVSNEYPTFDCAPGVVNPAFLQAYFSHPQIWSEIASGSKGLGDRRQRVHPEQVLAHKLFLPPISWQKKIDDVHAAVQNERCARESVGNELSVMLPAILDRAFRGEL